MTFSPLLRFVLLAVVAASTGEALAHGAIDERIEGMDLRIAENPSEPMRYLLRADLYREHRDWKSATSDIRTAAELEPDNPNIEFYRALLLSDLHRFSEAERSFGRFLERASAWPGPTVPLSKAHRMFAKMLVEQEKPCEAAGQLDSAIAAAARPTPQLYLSRAENLVRCDPPDYETAIRGLDAGIARLGPGATVLEDYAVELELARGSFESALRRVNAQIERAPKQPANWIRRAELLERAGRSAEALAAYRQAQAAIDSMPERARATRGARALTRQTEEGIGRVE